MNKQHLQNLLELADMACATGRITDDDQMIAAALAKKAGRALLAKMQEGQALIPVGEPSGAARDLNELKKEGRPKPQPAAGKPAKPEKATDKAEQ